MPYTVDATDALATHVSDTSNPHGVTAAQVGAYTTGQADTLLAAKAADSAVVHKTGAESIGGTKTFTAGIVVTQSATYAIDGGTAEGNGPRFGRYHISSPDSPGTIHSIGNGMVLVAGASDLSLFASVGTVHVAADGGPSRIGGPLRLDNYPEYADNTAALGAGLALGRIYRTGDTLKIVHA